MAKDPAVLLYTSDFLTGVMDMDMEERGQYITLLCAQHQKGHLSEKTIRLLVGSCSVIVLAKFQKDEDGNYYQDRMEKEIEKRGNYIDSRRVNGSLGGRPTKKHMDKHKVNHMPNHSDNENDNSNILIKEQKINFQIFWDLYDKKQDSKKSKIKWDQLPLKTQELILLHIPKYKQATPDRQFRKNPITYLNNDAWIDEPIINTKPEVRTFYPDLNKQFS